MSENANATFFVAFLIWAVVFGVAAGAVTQSKGRGYGEGALLGALLGIFGLIITAFLPARSPAARPGALPERRCPHCYQGIPAPAKVCAYCQRESTPWELVEGIWWTTDEWGGRWWLDRRGEWIPSEVPPPQKANPPGT